MSGTVFRGPVPTNNNWYIARLDYKVTRNGNHSLFWRARCATTLRAAYRTFLAKLLKRRLRTTAKGFYSGLHGRPATFTH